MVDRLRKHLPDITPEKEQKLREIAEQFELKMWEQSASFDMYKGLILKKLGEFTIGGINPWGLRWICVKTHGVDGWH